MDVRKVDFLQGIAINDVASGAIVRGAVGPDDAILIRRDDEFFIVGAQCSHYHGELADGLVAQDTIRCPLHHACFSLRTGTSLRAPAWMRLPVGAPSGLAIGYLPAKSSRRKMPQPWWQRRHMRHRPP